MQKLELVLVTGHTDPIGSQEYNQKLSERRADAVRNYLVSKGIAKDRIETLGMGETQPIPGLVCNQKNLQGEDRVLPARSPRRSRSQGRDDQEVRFPPQDKSPASAGLFLRVDADVASRGHGSEAVES